MVNYRLLLYIHYLGISQTKNKTKNLNNCFFMQKNWGGGNSLILGDISKPCVQVCQKHYKIKTYPKLCEQKQFSACCSRLTQIFSSQYSLQLTKLFLKNITPMFICGLIESWDMQTNRIKKKVIMFKKKSKKLLEFSYRAIQE